MAEEGTGVWVRSSGDRVRVRVFGFVVSAIEEERHEIVACWFFIGVGCDGFRGAGWGFICGFVKRRFVNFDIYVSVYVCVYVFIEVCVEVLVCDGVVHGHGERCDDLDRLEVFVIGKVVGRQGGGAGGFGFVDEELDELGDGFVLQ